MSYRGPNFKNIQHKNVEFLVKIIHFWSKKQWKLPNKTHDHVHEKFAKWHWTICMLWIGREAKNCINTPNFETKYEMLKYSKNYHIYLNFTAQSTNLTQLEYFCSKRESMHGSNSADKFSIFLFSVLWKWLIFWHKSQNFEKLYKINVKIWNL